MKTNETDTTTAIAAQSTKSTVLLSIDKIRPNPNNPRRSYDENALAELAASIATHGLIQPIRVRAAEQGGYIIVCGERRYRAVQLLGQTEIEAIVDAAPADERAIFDLALSENIQREEMPSLDEAEAYKATMQTLGGDAAAVAARFGKSEQYIYYRMKLNELIPDIKKLLRENSITLGLAMELARYGKDLQKTICKDRLKDEEGWRKYSVKEFKRMVDAHYTNDLARYRFDRTACAACKYNANTYDMFATGSGRCTNRECLEAKNRVVIGPSGGGKSFILNHICRQYYEQGAHIVIVDTGNSYQGLSSLIRQKTKGRDGIYFTYQEDAPVAFNPFFVEDGVYDVEKRESLKALLLTLWKRESEEPTRAEEVALSNAVNLYLSQLKTGTAVTPSFNTFYEFVATDYRRLLEKKRVREKDFDIENFLNVLEPYYRGGEYDYLLNSDKQLDLLDKRFIVFELDNISENKVLYPVITLIIMETFIKKMRRLKGIRKVLLLEEAWKAIAKAGMAGFIKYLCAPVQAA